MGYDDKIIVKWELIWGNFDYVERLRYTKCFPDTAQLTAIILMPDHDHEKALIRLLQWLPSWETEVRNAEKPLTWCFIL